jgi:hypothetical protein
VPSAPILKINERTALNSIDLVWSRPELIENGEPILSYVISHQIDGGEWQE